MTQERRPKPLGGSLAAAHRCRAAGYPQAGPLRAFTFVLVQNSPAIADRAAVHNSRLVRRGQHPQCGPCGSSKWLWRCRHVDDRHK